ncbi:hypothetical protein BGX23_012054 [Mortierella sp. AD031]|nr:hypothetical protein BGX23_012054 [Mortierella sp. AD031]
MAGLPLPGSNPTVSRGAASFVPRKLSTAVAVESDDQLPYSSGCDHRLSQQDSRFRKEPIVSTPISTRSSGSGSSVPAEPTSHFATGSTSKTHRHADDDELTLAATTSYLTEPLLPKQHNKTASSWQFPTKNTTSFSNDDPNPLDPVQSWTSTVNALSELYKSLHQIGSRSTSFSSSLRSALLHYNYLSRLQSMYDTILIPRRHTRTLFLLQGREPKTRANLEQLLRITTDLIWLNEKDRQKKRRSSSKPATSVSSLTATVSTGNTSPPHNDTPVPHVYNPADDYHGLRVSEYTVLMNWIGGVTALSSSTDGPTSAKSWIPSPATSTTSRPSPMQLYQHPIALSRPVDQAWAIWEDFVLTGMKPDIVLYTMLMDTLLKAKEFDRADQIWNHMERQGRDSGKGPSRNRPAVAGLGSMESVSRSFKHNSNKPTATARSRTQSESTSLGAVVPNIQTLSVLMERHIQESDIDGVARTYKDLHHTIQTQGQRPIDAVLVNQVLKILVDLGETKAARDIFAEMKVDSQEVQAPASASTNSEYCTNVAPGSSSASFSTTPIHHQTSRRRVSWKRESRKGSAASSSTTTSLMAATGFSIRPTEATYRLMLQVARREMDSDLEDQVLKELRLLSLPNSSSKSSK